MTGCPHCGACVCDECEKAEDTLEYIKRKDVLLEAVEEFFACDPSLDLYDGTMGDNLRSRRIHAMHGLRDAWYMLSQLKGKKNE